VQTSRVVVDKCAIVMESILLWSVNVTTKQIPTEIFSDISKRQLNTVRECVRAWVYDCACL